MTLKPPRWIDQAGAKPSPHCHAIHLQVDGHLHSVEVEPWVTLMELLRDRLHLTGTRERCNHGECGACTVLVDGRRTLACLQLAVMREGCDITTVEGLANGEVLHPLQDDFIQHEEAMAEAALNPPAPMPTITATVSE